MLNLDKAGIERLLIQVEDRGLLDSQYKFYKVNNELSLLGSGAFSSVYEMYDEKHPELHYAAKVVGLGNKDVDPDLITETTRLQYFLGEQSENILRVIALWEMKLLLDDDGNVLEVIGSNDTGYEEAQGLLLQIVFMEKLNKILSKDRYGNIALLREDLRTEDGVIRFARQIGRALFTVHNNNYLHRDVKLENIFWDERLRQYKLGDFGIAKYVGDGDAETVVFTDGYGAPEIERQLTESYNATADIYSLGVTLFLLLNELRFPASDGYHANIVQYSKDFVMPAPRNASERMARIIRKMCSYRMEDRYQSIEEVLMEIGRIDGSYTEQGFTEYDDSATETYGEDDDTETETYRETEEDNQAGEEIPWWRKAYGELNREERKKKEQSDNAEYAQASVWRMCISALLFGLLFKSLSPYAEYISSWQFWVLPIVLLIESVLLSIKEFYIGFGILTIGLGIFSACSVGIDVPLVAMLLSVVMGVPSIAAGCAIGTGLWIAQILTGKLAWLSFLSRWDLGWLVLIALYIVFENNAFIRVYYNKITEERYEFWCWIEDGIGYILVIIGIALIVLEHFHVLIIPDIIKHIHLVRVGMGISLVQFFEQRYYELQHNEE